MKENITCIFCKEETCPMEDEIFCLKCLEYETSYENTNLSKEEMKEF